MILGEFPQPITPNQIPPGELPHVNSPWLITRYETF